MRRAESDTPSMPNTIWFSPIATSMVSAAAAVAIRESSVSARAGTIAWASPPDPGSAASLTREPVGVGGGHGHRAVAELDQDARQHRPRLVLRRRPGDVVDRRDERLRGRPRTPAPTPRGGAGSPRRPGSAACTRSSRRSSFTAPLPAVCSRVTGCCGSARTISSRSRPVSTVEPGSATSAWRLARTESSMSVAASSTEPPASARMRIAGEDLNGRALRHPAGHDLEAVRAGLPADRRSSCGETPRCYGHHWNSLRERL